MLQAETLFSTDLVFYDWNVANTDELFTQLRDILVSRGNVTDTWIEGITTREAKYPTGILAPTINVALPHTDPEFIKEQYIAVIRPIRPICFLSMDGSGMTVQTDLIFNLGLNGNGLQVEILQRVLNLIMDKELLGKLLEKNTPQSLVEFLCEVF